MHQTVTVYLEVVWVQVSLVFVCGFVSPVAVFNDGVQKILEHFIRLLIASNAAHRHDEGMTWNMEDQHGGDNFWKPSHQQQTDCHRQWLNIAGRHVYYRMVGLAAIMRFKKNLSLQLSPSNFTVKCMGVKKNKTLH